MAKKMTLKEQYLQELTNRAEGLGLDVSLVAVVDKEYRKWLADRRLHKHINAAVAIEPDDHIGYMARAMVQATLPHSKPKSNEFKRVNGNYKLSMIAPSDIGLPYGIIPRLLLAWLTTEAVRTQSREIVLGDSLADFMRQLGMEPTGGRRGSITQLRDQCIRLFSTLISATYSDGGQMSMRNANIAESADLYWWDADPKQVGLWRSVVTLSSSFFNEITSRPIPISMDVIKHIKKSPLALDIYFWLTYRVAHLQSNTLIPWPTVAMFVGSGYGRIDDFRDAFEMTLKKVMLYYSGVSVVCTDDGLVLGPSKTHITRKAAAKKLKLSTKPL